MMGSLLCVWKKTVAMKEMTKAGMTNYSQACDRSLQRSSKSIKIAREINNSQLQTVENRVIE